MGNALYPYSAYVHQWVRCLKCGSVWLPRGYEMGDMSARCSYVSDGGRTCTGQCRPLLPHEEAAALLEPHYSTVEDMPLC